MRNRPVPEGVRTDTAAISPEPALSLITGLADDPREPLEPHHELYRMARRLRARQDLIDDRAHAEAFACALEVWPRLRGAERLHETQVAWAGMLLTQGYHADEIAYVLDVGPDTLRRRRILELGHTWRDELLEGNDDEQRDNPPHTIYLEGSARLPRVIEGRHPKTVADLVAEDAKRPMVDARVNLPGLAPTRTAEVGFLWRLYELRNPRHASRPE